MRERWLPALATGEVPLAATAELAGLLTLMADERTRLVLVDPSVPGVRLGLLAELAALLPHRPVLRSLEESSSAVPLIPPRPAAVLALARRGRARTAAKGWAARLAYSGLDAAALARVSQLAASRAPVLVAGPRGTGKELVARHLHELSDPRRRFVVVAATQVWRPEGEPGSLYLEDAHLLADLSSRLREAAAAGWRLFAGSRAALEGAPMETLSLRALRERPEQLAPLVQHFLEVHARTLGLPRRRFHRTTFALLQAWSWPQNDRELDRFVYDVLVSVDEPVIRAEHLPPALRARLDPDSASAGGGLEGFEEMVSARLAPVVQGWHDGGGTDLHALVIDAAERALLRLVLARTQGNRKAGARLLGVARNTLHSHLARLGVTATSE